MISIVWYLCMAVDRQSHNMLKVIHYKIIIMIIMKHLNSEGVISTIIMNVHITKNTYLTTERKCYTYIKFANCSEHKRLRLWLDGGRISTKKCNTQV